MWKLLFAQTQSDLDEQANQGFLKADKELNEVYNKIIREYKNDTLFIKSLKKSQKIWIQLRDAEMETKFPERETGYYGSVLPMLLVYIQRRIDERKNYDIERMAYRY